MKVLLSPRSHLAYGQDFQSAGMQKHCGLTTLYKSDGKYHWPDSTALDLVVTQNPDDRADSTFVREKGRDVPVVAHVHCRWDYYSEAQQNNIIESLGHATVGIVPAKFLKRDMEGRFPDVAWYTVPNGVRVDLFRPTIKIDRDAFRQRHLLSEDTKLVAFSGRLEDAKGAQILEEICKRIAGKAFVLFIQFPNWQAIRDKELVRDRYYETAHRLRQLNPRQVIVWGDEAPRFDNRPVRFCDVLLSPSLSEVQPLVVLEALASGVPVIATDCTPFYDEQQLFGNIPAPSGIDQWLEPLPERLNRGSIARDARLSDKEATEIADALMEKLDAVGVADDRQRELLATRVIDLGYTEASMNAKLRRLFDQTIEFFNDESPPLQSGETYPLEQAIGRRLPAMAGMLYLLNGNDLVQFVRIENIRARTLPLVDGGELGDTSGVTHFRFEVTEDWKALEEELKRGGAPTKGKRT